MKLMFIMNILLLTVFTENNNSEMVLAIKNGILTKQTRAQY